MKAWVQLLAVIGIATAGAGATRLILGPPDRGVVCDPAKLEPHEVCLESLAPGTPGILWVDARPRAEWQRDGVPGSVLVTDHSAENLDALIAEAFPKLLEAKQVVVYCSDIGCGSSKAIANILRDLKAGPEVVFLHGGWRALAAAGMVTQAGN
jgi:rhodanese-related sulfurtransferase